MKLRRHFVLAALAAVLLLAGTVFHTQVLGSGREVLDTDDYAEGEEEEEGTLPEGWIEIGDHEYMNPSTGEWAKVHVTEENREAEVQTQHLTDTALEER